MLRDRRQSWTWLWSQCLCALWHSLSRDLHGTTTVSLSVRWGLVMIMMTTMMKAVLPSGWASKAEVEKCWGQPQAQKGTWWHQLMCTVFMRAVALAQST